MQKRRWPYYSELGLESRNTAFTAVGAGDTSGDVFSNGMLLSRHFRLVARFNHPCSFLHEEGKTFSMTSSSRDDYDLELISSGGGVWSPNGSWTGLLFQAVPAKTRSSVINQLEALGYTVILQTADRLA